METNERKKYITDALALSRVLSRPKCPPNLSEWQAVRILGCSSLSWTNHLLSFSDFPTKYRTPSSRINCCDFNRIALFSFLQQSPYSPLLRYYILCDRVCSPTWSRVGKMWATRHMTGFYSPCGWYAIGASSRLLWGWDQQHLTCSKQQTKYFKHFIIWIELL